MDGVERTEQGVSEEGACSARIVGTQVPTRTSTQDVVRAERRTAPWSFGGGGTFPPEAASVTRPRGWSCARKKVPGMKVVIRLETRVSTVRDEYPIFQKGHIIMRGDPAWGADAEALAAEADTFFYTNAAPQLGFSIKAARTTNQEQRESSVGAPWKLMSYGTRSRPGSGFTCSRARFSMTSTDGVYRHDSKVPMRFWKIAVWADGSRLRSVEPCSPTRSP